MVKNAQAICASCSDPVLRTAVSNYANAANNYGTQLKVLSFILFELLIVIDYFIRLLQLSKQQVMIMTQLLRLNLLVAAR